MSDEWMDDPESLTFVPPGGPGRLDELRVRVVYADGCETAFAQGVAVTVRQALANHAGLHKSVSGGWG